MNIFLEIVLLNAPEAFLYTTAILYANNKLDFRSSKYWISFVLSLSIVYLSPIIMDVILVVQIYMTLAQSLYFSKVFELDFKSTTKLTTCIMFIMIVSEILITGWIMSMIGISNSEFFDLSVFTRFLILIPCRLSEYLITYIIINLKGGNMRKHSKYWLGTIKKRNK